MTPLQKIDEARAGLPEAMEGIVLDGVDEYVEYALTLIEEYPALRRQFLAMEEALKRLEEMVVGAGHNDDCMFCGFKDKQVSAYKEATKECYGEDKTLAAKRGGAKAR